MTIRSCKYVSDSHPKPNPRSNVGNFLTPPGVLACVSQPCLNKYFSMKKTFGLVAAYQAHKHQAVAAGRRREVPARLLVAVRLSDEPPGQRQAPRSQDIRRKL